MSELLRVEVALALADRQQLVTVQVPAGSTIRDAVQASGIASHFPELELDELEKGIWGRRRPEDHEVRSGDRVEIYRPLVVDPREARRRRAGRSG